MSVASRYLCSSLGDPDALGLVSSSLGIQASIELPPPTYIAKRERGREGEGEGEGEREREGEAPCALGIT